MTETLLTPPGAIASPLRPWYLVAAVAALGVMIAAILGNSLWFLNFLHVMAAQEPVGRKLDFLIQEMNREINTIGSKSNNSEIAQHVVDVKSILEKIREQVQNIE